MCKPTITGEYFFFLVIRHANTKVKTKIGINNSKTMLKLKIIAIYVSIIKDSMSYNHAKYTERVCLHNDLNEKACIL